MLRMTRMRRNAWLLLLCCLLTACANRISLTPLPTPTPDPSSYSRIVTREPNPGTPTMTPTFTPRPRLGPYPTPTFATYIVQPGDNLGQIAKDHGISLEALIMANGIEDPNYIRMGQKLLIPPPNVTPSPRQIAASVMSSSPQGLPTLPPSGRKDRIVYVTDKDDHYHREGCPLLKGKNPIPMACEDAIEMGYTPCRVCNPSCP